MRFVNRATFLCFFVVALLIVAPLSSPLRAQEDPSGEWAGRLHEDAPERGPGPEIGDYLGIPLNDAGRLRADSWDAQLIELPENQCRPHSSDYGWRSPFPLRIWKEVDRTTQQVIAYHTHLGAYGNEQVIWMDGRPHPPDYDRHTWQGFTTGHWEGDTLVTFTDHLKENWLSLTGIPRSSNATVTTHFLRHGDYLTIAVIVYDPAYLTEPLIRTTDFVYAPQQQRAPYPCESVDEVDRPAGVVPSHLLGENPFLTEFPADHGVPPQAIRDGAEATYPEYIKKLKTMTVLPRPPGKHSIQ